MRKVFLTMMIFAFIANVSAQPKVDATGWVGTGTANPQYKLDITGNTNLSDKRTKKNIQANVPGLIFINLLQPVTYNMDLGALDELLNIDSPKLGRDGLPQELPQELIDAEKEAREAQEKIVQTGFLAQDVEDAAQSIGYDFSGVDKSDTEIYGLQYATFVVPLTKAVQELSEQNGQLQAQINELNGQLTQLRSGNAAESATGLRATASSSAYLQQNNPNPFNQSTQIKYYLPATVKIAYLCIYDLQGAQLKQMAVPERGEGVQTLYGSELKAGIYLYTLIADGQEVDTKRMILTK
jgi:hypothetical protein